MKNIMGLKFHMLTIIEDLGTKQEKNGHWVRWIKCLCDCGNSKITRFHTVKNGMVTSCGCKYKPISDVEKKKRHTKSTSKYRKAHKEQYRIYKHKLDRTINVRFTVLKHIAKIRNLILDITKEQYAEILKNPCYYCGSYIGNETGGGLDRINNAKNIGYRIDNVVPCCGCCNATRGARFTVEEMKTMMAALMSYRRKNDSTLCG